MNQYREEFLKGFTEQRFPRQDATPPTYTIGGALLSIGSLLLLSASSLYMAQLLNQPSVAFHLTKNQANRCSDQDPVFASLVCYVEHVVCFFPHVLYTEDTKARFFDDCHKSVLAGSYSTEEPAGALWGLLPYYFTIYGATLGCIFELGLLLTGHAFQQSLNRYTIYIVRLRLLNIGPVVASLFFYATALMIPTSDVPFLKILLYSAIFMVVALSVGLYWGGYRVLGGMDMLPLVVLGIQVVEFLFVVRIDIYVCVCEQVNERGTAHLGVFCCCL